MRAPLHEPHKIKTVRLLSFPSFEERKKHLAEARFNVFNLTPSELTFDMCSYGTSAVSQEQLAGQLLGDEAYAGAVNFEHLERAVDEVLGHTYTCPTHNLLGCLKLCIECFVAPQSRVIDNGFSRADVLSARGLTPVGVRDGKAAIFTGNVDLDALERALGVPETSMVLLQAFADGQHPFTLENLTRVRQLADRFGVRLVLDASRIVENAWVIQQHEAGEASRSIASLVRRMSKLAHLVLVDGAQDPKANAGGLIATDNPADHEKLINAVVVFEGLHTYGGMSGRTMEVLARGLGEMCDESEVHWVMHQTLAFCARLREAGVPLERGSDGAYLDAAKFLPHLAKWQKHALAAALYLTSGVRACITGTAAKDERVPLQIPRLAMGSRQLEQVADAVVALYRQRERVPALELKTESVWNDQLEFRGVFGDLQNFEFDTYPFVFHTIERVGWLSREQREQAIRTAGYNTFLLRSEDVTIDLLTDSGTSAMSTDQWAAYDAARATGATSDAYRRFVEVLEDVYGYAYVLPTHQGRAAEQVLSESQIKQGQLVPGNMYFTTTKEHQERCGGVFVDVIVDAAHDPASEFPWKGNIDMAKLAACVDKGGPANVAYISFEHSVNMAGGQPVSMDNMKEVYAYASARKIPVFFDATRAVENAFMIQRLDPRYKHTHIRDILREMMLYGDGATVSGKKDYLINIGGALAFKDNAEWAKKAGDLLRIHEGNVTDGGLAVADLAAMARGVEEMLDDRYIRSRVQQTERLGRMLIEAGVPIVRPIGTHAVFIDAKRFLPHVDQDEFPAQRLAAEIYVETGVRCMERGNVSKGRDAATGKNCRPALELVRLTIPRRVYTNDHMRAIADGVARVYARRDQIRGLRFVYEPEHLRFFQARFELAG